MALTDDEAPGLSPVDEVAQLTGLPGFYFDYWLTGWSRLTLDVFLADVRVTHWPDDRDGKVRALDMLMIEHGKRARDAALESSRKARAKFEADLWAMDPVAAIHHATGVAMPKFSKALIGSRPTDLERLRAWVLQQNWETARGADKLHKLRRLIDKWRFEPFDWTREPL